MQPQPIPPGAPRMAETRVHGLNCPVCRTFIPVDMFDLLHKNDIACPGCGLRLTINKTQSKQALDALAKVEQAVRKVRETETFTR